MTTLPKKVVVLTALTLVVASLLFATAPVPRTPSELTFLEPSGKQVSLSSFQGKVVVMEFLLMNCPHCARVALVIGKLDKELGPRGLQAIGVAFDNDVGGGKVTDFAQRLGITYPVGYTSAAAVDIFLGRKPSEQFMVPQIVVIDRHGVVRAQSRPIRESSLEDENSLRNLVNGLLKEAKPKPN